jgi:hypothetical protein
MAIEGKALGRPTMSELAINAASRPIDAGVVAELIRSIRHYLDINIAWVDAVRIENIKIAQG